MGRYGYRKVLKKPEWKAAWILSVFFLILLLCFVPVAVSAIESPYYIHTAENLSEFAELVNSGDNCSGVTVILDSDIDLGSCASWVPIGNKSSRSFDGNFDGGHHTISNLTITDYSFNYCGLFGYLNGGSITNLTLVNLSVSSVKSYVGGLVGCVESSGAIINCSVCAGTVSSSGQSDIGGIAGLLSGTMEYCCSAINVSGSGTCLGNVGGLAGEIKRNSVSSIRNSYFAGCTVTSISSDVGGIAGLAGQDSVVTLQNCYTAGAVTGLSPTKSFIGKVRGTVSVSGSFELVKDKPYVKHFSDWGVNATISGDAVWNNFTQFEECGFSSSVWKIDSSLPAYMLPVFVWQDSDRLSFLNASYLHAVHTEVTDAAVNATCTSSGLTAGSHCTVCNLTLIPQTVIPALQHNEVIDPAVSPTYSSPGLTEGLHCSRCGEVIAAQQFIPVLERTRSSQSGSSVLLPSVYEAEVINPADSEEAVSVEEPYLMPDILETAAEKRQAVASFVPLAGLISGLCAAYCLYRRRI
ncbi:MAG TPA: hypothetical protein O0X97_02095 [Methanocorpusculum sp.]|nr:hypothetical protein [Methanocorpusculum sp.]